MNYIAVHYSQTFECMIFQNDMRNLNLKLNIHKKLDDTTNLKLNKY